MPWPRSKKACAARRRSRNDWDGRLRMSYGSEKASSIPGWHIRQNVDSWHSPFPAWVISFAEPHCRRNRPMTTEHRENRSLPIRTAVEPASLTLVYPYELRADAHGVVQRRPRPASVQRPAARQTRWGCNQLPQPRPRHSPTNCYH